MAGPGFGETTKAAPGTAGTIRAEGKFPVGAADKERSSLRVERLAKDGETGDWRNLIGRAMDGKNTFTVSPHGILRLRFAPRRMTGWGAPLRAE